MDDLHNVFQADQSAAYVESLAVLARGLYRALAAQGFSEKQTEQLTYRMVPAILNGMFQVTASQRGGRA